MISLSAIALVSVAAAAAPVRIDHLPPAEAASGLPLTLSAQVENGHLLESFELRWRPRGGSYRAVQFGKDAKGRYAAVIEASDVHAPGLEYYLSAQEQGGAESERFASAALPHTVLVVDEPGALEREQRLAAHHGHTSSAQLTGELVDFGAHGGRSDRYYLLEASYQYRLLGPVQHIRLGAGTLRGDVPPPQADGTIALTASRHTGLDFGYGELAFNLGERAGFTARLIIGADELGFAMGAAGMLRIGRETYAHVELAGQYINRFGYDGSMRLAWDTVDRCPLGFSVHITNMPNAPVVPGSTPDHPLTDGGAPTGIRALLDAGFEATPHLTLLMKGGYQARFSTAGGPTLGAGAQVEW